MRRVQHLDLWREAATRALDAGAVKASALSLSWDASGKDGSHTKCSRPVHVEHRGAKAMNVHTTHGLNASDAPIYRIDIQARCRKCPGCLKARAAYWRLAAINEMSRAQRTWFGTLTLRPDIRFLVLSRARHRLAAQSIDFDTLNEDERFAELVREVNPSITRYFKRVRKESGSAMRYLLVSEAHKDGMPHWHCLIHEVAGSEPVKGRTLKSQWKGGFAKFNLVAQGENTPAFYVAKYLAKEARTRVRASLDYGSPPDALVEDVKST